MASSFKNYTATGIGTTPVTVFTGPASTETVIIGLIVSNSTASQIEVNVEVAGVSLSPAVKIPAGSGYSFVDGKINVDAGETITVTSNTLASAEAIISTMEKS